MRVPLHLTPRLRPRRHRRDPGGRCAARGCRRRRRDGCGDGRRRPRRRSSPAARRGGRGGRGVTPVVALSIAGSDSGGGAGTQADLKTFAALGVFGTSAIAALTAQNTATVEGVHVPPPDFLDQQIEAVLSDFDVRAVKRGMLATAANVAVVARRAAAGALPNLVVDPVLVASTGRPLLEPDAEQAYVEQLFPSALVVTPNLREASRLLGVIVSTVDDMGAAARELHAMGPGFVVVKGGHLGDDS